MNKFEKDLTSGNVFRQLIVFALPFLVSNFIQSLYSVADMIIVGNLAGVVSMSGVNNGSQMTMLVTNAVIGLAVGATVLIGQYMGSGKKEEINKTIKTLFTLLIIIATGLTVITPFVDDALLGAINIPAEAFGEAKSYFFICMMGTVFVFAYNALAAVMRGMGDSKHPLIFVAVAAFTNIGLDFLFVGVFKLGASGAALATVASQALSAILCIAFLRKNNFIFHFSFRSLGIDRTKLKLLFKIGIPTMITNIAVSVSFLYLIKLANDISVEASAAVGAVGKFNCFAILPAIAMQASVSAMVAQNFGSGKLERVKKTTLYGTVIAICCSAVMFVAVNLFPEAILRIFADSDEMARLGTEYVRSFSFDYLIVPFVFALNGLFIGTGHTMVSLVSGICSSVLFRIPACYIFGVTLNMGLAGIGLGAPIASAAALIIVLIFFLSGKWKKRTLIHSEP